MKARGLIMSALSLMFGLAISQPVRAASDGYPNHPIRMIIPFGASSGLNPVGRAIAERMQAELNTPVIVDNREGAGGQIGVTAGANAEPDGYTITMIVHPPFAAQPYLLKNPTYDPYKFTPIARVVTTPLLLIATKSAPFTDFASMVAYARQNPGKLQYASSGIGTASHLDMERLKLGLHLDLGFVPYKSTGQQMTDTIGGQVALSLPSLAGGLPTVLNGDVLALAVGSAQRTPLLPNVPTFAEATGIADFESVVWYGFVGPEKLPAGIVEVLGNAMKQALTTEQVRKVTNGLGAEPAYLGAAEFGALIRKNAQQAHDLIRTLNLPLE